MKRHSGINVYAWMSFRFLHFSCNKKQINNPKTKHISKRKSFADSQGPTWSDTIIYSIKKGYI